MSILLSRREELGLRLSFLFVSAAISGGFGGLIAFGIAHIKSGALSPWQVRAPPSS